MTVTDTLGRAAVSLQTNVGSGSVTVSGLSNPYTYTWGNPGGSPPPTGQTADSGNTQYCNGRIPAYSQNTQVVTSVTLPNGQEYQFSYGGTYGLLSQITYPTGAWVKYTWGVSTRGDQVALSDSLAIPEFVGTPMTSPR